MFIIFSTSRGEFFGRSYENSIGLLKGARRCFGYTKEYGAEASIFFEPMSFSETLLAVELAKDAAQEAVFVCMNDESIYEMRSPYVYEIDCEIVNLQAPGGAWKNKFIIRRISSRGSFCEHLNRLIEDDVDFTWIADACEWGGWFLYER